MQAQKYYLLIEVEVTAERDVSSDLLEADCVVDADGVEIQSAAVSNVYKDPLPPYM